MIVKASDDEARLLDRCLFYASSYVDEICLTITGENKECERVAKKYSAKVSHFKWVKDFAKARNFNFSQATGDYILWLDCDDVLKGAEYLGVVLKKMGEKKVDAGVMDYLYDFNDQKECTVKHLKTRIVKNDGCVEWVGEVHEDFDSKRELRSYFIEDIQVMHLTEEKRTKESAKRNTEIAESVRKKNQNDPRGLYLVANALMGEGKYKESITVWEEFVKKSGSEEEKYLAYLFLSDLYNENYVKSEELACKALILRPSYPNAYFKLARMAYKRRSLDSAKNFIEIGLQLPIPDKQIIVFNPREYDYHPLMLLLDIAFDKGEYQRVEKILDTLSREYPKDTDVKNKKAIFDSLLGELKDVDAVIKKAETLKGEGLKEYINGLSEKMRMHPKICTFYNLNFIKTESSGKDLVYYCGYTSKAWSPKTVSKGGIGGSEEAVINLSREFARLGWNVTVYNNCGKDFGVYDGVTYQPYWNYNVRDKNDVTIYWRHPRAVDFHEHGKAFIDMHDVIPPGEFTEERLAKIDKIFVKSMAHRVLFPDVPDEKFVIAQNGIDFTLFEKKVEKNPYLIVNTSSPDRHLEATLDVFEELIKRQPEKPWKLAWYYGWGVYDDVHEKNPDMMAWKTRQMARFDALKTIGRAEGGEMISHTEIAHKYLESQIFLYPTQFYEIDCISARKAQIAGCKVISSDFAALKETVQFGYKIHTNGEKWGKESFFGDDNVDAYVDAILSHDDLYDQKDVNEWAQQFAWENIAKKWNNNL